MFLPPRRAPCQPARTEQVSLTLTITYTQQWDVENRLVAVTNTSTLSVTQFMYDGDGKRVKRVEFKPGTSLTTTTVYIGATEVVITSTGRVTTTYYFAGSTRVAMRQGSVLYFLHSDHLGSASLTTDASGTKFSEERYTPYGETRSGSSPTDYQFTGQLRENGLGSLYDYGARRYSPVLGRFLSADTIVPSPGNPQSLNRFSYVRNNPLRYVDPTGHFTDDALKTYLQKVYGDAWQSHWDSWQADSNWMKLVHDAQAGDVLTWVTTNAQGHASLQTFQFQGKGQDELSLLSQIQDIDANPEQTGYSANLDWFFSHRGKGIGVLRFATDGNISVVGTLGDVGFSVHKVTEEDVDARNTGIGVSLWGVGTPVNPLVGLLLAATSGFFNRRISMLPGLTVGDNELCVSTFTPTGPPDDYYGTPIVPGVGSGYEYTFRNGQRISRGGIYRNVYVPHRPF